MRWTSRSLNAQGETARGKDARTRNYVLSNGSTGRVRVFPEGVGDAWWGWSVYDAQGECIKSAPASFTRGIARCWLQAEDWLRWKEL